MRACIISTVLKNWVSHWKYVKAPKEINMHRRLGLKEREKIESVNMMAFKVQIFVKQSLRRNEMSSIWGSKTFSMKDQIVSIFVGHVSSDTTSQLYHCSLKTDINKM